MADKGKVTLNAEKLWLIRSIKTSVDGRTTETRYYETAPCWNKSPMEATIFQNYEAAEAHLGMVRYNFSKFMPNGYTDGSVEVFDITSLYTEMLHSPNSVKVVIKPN